ncbi:hypothetical protein Tco_0058474 [Tanacetum coccineum]
MGVQPRYILEMYRNNKFWWKKDSLVIPCGLAWSKIGNFEKGDYGALFAKWSNPIMCMDEQPNGPITASPKGIQPIICAAVVHDPQFEQQPKEVVESVPLFTSEELVAEYHYITTTVQLIENVGDGDPSIVLKELAAIKQMMNAIERFIKSRNDNLSEDSVAKQSVEKEIESSDGKGTESSISDVFHGELSVVETSKNEALSEEFDPKEYDKNVDDSGVGNASESEIINVLTGQVSCDKYVGGFYEYESSKLYYTDPKEYPSSSMTQLLQVAVPEQTSSQMLAYTLVDLNLPNLNQSFTESQVNEYAEFDFDNPENDSLSVMVKTEEEEIHLDGLETVDDPFVQTPDKQNYEGEMTQQSHNQTQFLSTTDRSLCNLFDTTMMTLADKSLLLGGDNKPPMLEKHLYDSWKSQMELYMLNRPHGRMILASVEKGPLV